MVALRYKDEHNKVGYLLKPTGSDDYHQIIDFLSASHISPIAIALICLSDGRRFNWSSYIFKGMVSNIGNAKKFLMYPRFLQTILGIETKVTRQYKVLVFSSKLFANMTLNFAGHPMPLLPTMLLQAQAGEGAEVAEQAVPHLMHAPDQSPTHFPTPSRPQTFDPVAPVLKHGHSSDPHTASVSHSHENDAGPFTTVDAIPMGGDFHTYPPRSSHAPPAGQLSGGEEDPITLTALSSVVSNLVQKVHTLESELQDHKKFFKYVVGKLVKKVKTLKVNLKTKKRKMVPKCSYCCPSGTSGVPPGASDVHIGASTVPTDVSFRADPTGVSSNGKSLMVEEDIPVRAMTFKQMEDDRLARVEANASLSKTLLGDDVSENNFPARMAALIRRKRQDLAAKLAQERQNRPITQAEQRAYMTQYVKNQSSVIYNTGWTMAYVKSFTDDQLKQEFEKIRKVQSNSQIQAFSRTLKRPGPVLDKPSSKRQKSPDAPTPSMLEDSDDEVTHDWFAVVGWEVLPTPLGEINALYRIDGSTKHFTTLRQIIHMVDRQDLVKLYGLVVQYYENHPAAGAGLILWGDLQIFFDSHATGKGSCVWQNQHLWEIQSWRLYTFSNVHVLETVSGEVLSMFTDVSYPLSVKLMERMLMHKLEIDSDIVRNDMNTAEQLIHFIKNQLVAAQASSV
nr:aminoacyl-tRNA synthetase, class 1a, anticodon-binding [Tanacetum cinerariifolium]